MKKEIPTEYPADLSDEELSNLIKEYSTSATSASRNPSGATPPMYWSEIARLGSAEKLNRILNEFKVENKKQSKRNKLLNILTIFLSIVTISLAIFTVRYAEIDYRSDKVWQDEQIRELQKQTEKLMYLVELTQRKPVTFITTIDLVNATKDGIWLNGYVVNISYSEAKRLDGKKVKVSGIVTIQKGLENLPKKYDKNGTELVQQGRQGDIWHIEHPIIEIIEN